ncbi:MAG: adenylate/guanylate cyclase domain-containing protein [bacterium]
MRDNYFFRNMLVVFACVLIIGISWFAGIKDLLNNIESIMYDWRAQISVDGGPFSSKFRKADNNIILLTDDQSTNDKLMQYPKLALGRWPWPRKTWGDVITFINKGKPKAIVFDIKFEGSEGNDIKSVYSDKYMADVLKKHKNVILGVALSYPRESISKEVNDLTKQRKFSNNNLDSYVYKQLNISSIPLKKALTLNIDDKSIQELPSTDKNIQNLLNNITFYGNSAISPELLASSHSLGVINLKSGDSLVARVHEPLYRLAKSQGVQYIPSLPLATVIALSDKDENASYKLYQDRIESKNRIIPIDEEGKLLINWHGKASAYKNISISKVLISEAFEKGKINKINPSDRITSDFFKDKIIVIGQTAPGTDFHPTPMGMVYPGTEIIATSIDNLLHDTLKNSNSSRNFIKKADFITNFMISLLFCAAIVIFIIKARSNLLSLAGFFLVVFFFIILALILFAHPQIRIWVNMTYPLILMTVSSIGTYLYKIHIEKKDKQQIENLFGKFVSPQVLDKLLKDPKSVSREGQRKYMTVLFSDIRSFTTLSEKIPPHELISQLNEYMTEMVEVILKHNGTLDKYIGDAIMAFYGDPLPMEDHALRSVLTAISMMESLKFLNKKWAEEGKHVLDIGIGINTGDMIVGHMGSPRLLDYTVVGDNVNLASRLEGLNKEYKTNIIISETTYNEVKEYINTQYLDECKVKGKDNAVKIYCVLGVKEGIKLENYSIKA